MLFSDSMAVTENVFQKINRPESSLSIEKYIRGLAELRKEFAGKIWLEIFFLPEYNLNIEELSELKEAIVKINPDSVQLNTLDRPGTVANLISASSDELEKIVESWNLDNVEVIVTATTRKNIQSYRGDVEEAILSTISRRPCTIDDLIKILGLHINEINKYLDVLEAADKIESAVGNVLDKGLRTVDIYTEGCTQLSTTEMGDAVLNEL